MERRSDTTFEFTVPYNSYSDSSDVGIRATGSVAAYFNRVSSSLTNTLTNYTILHITDMGSNTRKFTIRANNVGSEFNSDIAEHWPLGYCDFCNVWRALSIQPV